MDNKNFLIYLSILSLYCFKCCVSRDRVRYVADAFDYHTIEQEILRLMGFPEISDSQSKAPVRKRSAPDFMLEIYNDQTSKNQFNVSDINRRMTAKSDVIISFMAEQPHSDGEKPERVRRMWFDVSGIAKENDFLYGELRLYRSIEGLRRKHLRPHKIVVDKVYRDKFHEKQFEEIASVVITANFEGWITLNITSAFRRWLEHPRENRGIRVLTFPTERENKRVKAENMGIVGFDGAEEEQPFITGYFKNINNNKIRMKIKDIIYRNKRLKRSAPLSVDTFTHRQLNRPVSTYVGECERRNYHVNFKDIKWHEWIIAPEGYDMYFCDGKCTFPLTTTANATNYAVTLSLYHKIHPDKVPEPCCVATKLSPIQLLYFENENRVVYKKYTSMVVDGCGCR
ncbi:protein 60A-like [Chelonus insularis]|uniref:protein 60A-like n=1 Tax=Chelonus insularis TaxID=460826 RepID=UPI00158CE686|nr:protein 60A-like [Chelonus insularis]